MEGRDQKREELRKGCEAAWSYLDGLPEFQQRVSECGKHFTDPPAAGYSEEKFHGSVAERVINNIVEVPDHYSDHEFWARSRDELMKFRSGTVFEQADEAGLQLERSNDDVSAALIKVRKDLGEKYDIPWAPYYDESLAVPGR